MKLEPKQRAEIEAVAKSAKSGTPLLFVYAKSAGACAVLASPYKTRVPAKSAWLPPDTTEVRMTAFMNEPATSTWPWGQHTKCAEERKESNALAPTAVKTIVKGDVVVVLLDRFG
jgi:hypothetical protein